MTATTNHSGKLTFDTGIAPSIPREWTWLNWALALLAAPVAVLVMNFALNLGSDGLLFDMLYQGAAVVAGVTIFASFFTATRPLGFVVPLLGWGLLVADVAVLAAVFAR
jgi:hypothetical protein